jgi:ferrous iron transport protein B
MSKNDRTIIKTPRIALVGNPNVGKSTLFNILTKSKQRVINMPGVTVDIEEGIHQIKNRKMLIADLPGSNSLLPLSADEEVTTNYILGYEGSIRPDAIIFVASKTHFLESAYFLRQLFDLKIPVIVAFTMNDLAKSNHTDFDSGLLKDLIPFPIVEINPNTLEGFKELDKTILEKVVLGKATLNNADNTETTETQIPKSVLTAYLDSKTEDHFEFVAKIDEIIEANTSNVIETKTEKIDRIILNKYFAIPIFLLIMFIIFEVTTTLTAPINDFINSTFKDGFTFLIEQFAQLLQFNGTWLESLLVDGLLEGVLSVLSFVVPISIVFILLGILEGTGYLARFSFVADKMFRKLGLDGKALLPIIIGFGCNLPSYSATKIMADSNQRKLISYLIPFTLCSARLAVFSVISTVVFEQYAGIMFFLMYLISCVLIVIIGILLRTFSPVFKKIQLSPFILALPYYQVPNLKNLFKFTIYKVKDFVFDAGKIIVTVVVIFWILGQVPAISTATPVTEQTTGTLVSQTTPSLSVPPLPNEGEYSNDNEPASLYEQIATGITPVFKPLGFGDYHFSSALVSGFIAKEVVVGSLIESYNATNATQSEIPDQAENDEINGADDHIFKNDVIQSFETASDGHKELGAFSFMLFVLLYTPCLATVAEAKRLFGAKFMFKSMALNIGTAYILCLIIYQIGILL